MLKKWPKILNHAGMKLYIGKSSKKCQDWKLGQNKTFHGKVPKMGQATKSSQIKNLCLVEV